MSLELTPPVTSRGRASLCFIGVATSGSAIQRVFPRWCERLGLEADLVGIDLPLGAPPEAYRATVAAIAGDPLARGALVTSHKIDLYRAAAALLGRIEPAARRLREISCLRKHAGRLIGDALDPLTSRLALAAFLPPGHWSAADAEVLCFGAGGAALAIVDTLLGPNDDRGRPRRVTVTDRDRGRLATMAELVPATGLRLELVVRGCENDALLRSLPAGSLVINATGLGKDRPGSPIADDTPFPERSFVWELNYRGALDFLRQAEAQAEARRLHVEDGWTYFVHGWTRHIAAVFDREIATEGALLAELDRVARAAVALG